MLERAQAVEGVGRRDAAVLADAVHALRDTDATAQERLEAGTGFLVRDVLARHPVRELVTTSPTYPLLVQRERALFSAWYEFFPRSEGAHVDPVSGRWVSGTFATAANRLPAVRDLGLRHRLPAAGAPGRQGEPQGPQQHPDPGSRRPRLAWAIGSDEGGHDAINPELGTFDDFDAFVARARALGLEVAIDLALQCAPDHPWAREHPEWFTTRVDGTIAYAENPPKKYQDIYPLNFDNDPESASTGRSVRVLRGVDRPRRRRCSASTTRTPSRSTSGSGSSPRVRARTTPT